ncbi:AAA family ATPase [Candidatus Dojkabacteria bacterium]|nr:AAA family ATPase [Candidatus Dojkabacteria bacterium]
MLIKNPGEIKIPTVLEFMNLEFGDNDWLVDNMIPSGGSVIIVAKRESYKTWFALYLSKCITEGSRLWDKFRTHKSSVLYITNDDPPRSFQKRLEQFSFSESFFIYHKNLTDFSIELNNGSFQAVKQLIASKDIGLVIVDILRNTHNKDSNADKDSKLVFDKYKELRESNPNVVLIFVMHPSKEPSIEKGFRRRQSEEAVGSYYWEASVDTVFSLSKRTESDVDKVSIVLTKNKQSEKMIKPFIGIQKKAEGPVEFVFEEQIPDKIKIDEIKEHILQLLTEGNYKRQEIIDLLTKRKISGSRLVEEALKELTNGKLVAHSVSKPHIYTIAKNETINDSAFRTSI